MPFKPKHKPNVVPKEELTLVNAETRLPHFFKYYKGIELVPEDEWKHLLQALLSSGPAGNVCYRIAERLRKSTNPLDGKPGTLTEGEALREMLKTDILPKVDNVEIGEKTFEMTPLPWYPKQLAWTMNINLKTLINEPKLESLRSFTLQEEKMFNIFKQDIPSMCLPLLVDIQPEHKILELKAGTGYNTTQILEQLLSNPKKLAPGFVICNEQEPGRNQFRWNQGSNVVFTQMKESKFPDIYLTEDHDPESKLQFDIVFYKAGSSDDGTCTKLRSGWAVTTAHKNHVHLKTNIRRGLELLQIGGQLVYATSSMNPIENEAVVAGVLEASQGSVELIDIKKRLPGFHMRDGLTSWKVMSEGQVFYENFEASPAWFQKENEKSMFPPEDVAVYNLERCARVMPHDNNTEAVFWAVFRVQGALPWLQEKEEEMQTKEEEEEETETETKTETTEVKKEAVKEETPSKPKEESIYHTPVRCDVSVVCSEIVWEDEVTDDKLNTTVDEEIKAFPPAPLHICTSSIKKPYHNKRTVIEYMDVPTDNEDWKAVKQLFDLKKVDTSNLLMYQVDGGKHQYTYVTPALKPILKYNPELYKKSRTVNSGLLFMQSSVPGHPDVKFWGMMPFFPFMNKLLISLPKNDMILLLQNNEVLFSKFSDKTRTALQNMPNGSVYMYYEPKGKNADPKCPFFIRREKHTKYMKNSKESSSTGVLHFLRLCGIHPTDVETTEESMEVE